MRNFAIVVVLLILIGGASYFFYQTRFTPVTAAPSPTPTANTSTNPTSPAAQSTFCTPSQLQATMDEEVAAGNAYVQIMLKNTSSSSCQVIGNNTLSVGYSNSVTNFKTDVKRQPTTPAFTLAPNQTIYALVHFPNGPQCSSEGTDVNSMVSYQINDKDTVSFKPTRGDTLLIPSCGKASEVTMIDLYPFSSTQVTP